MAVIAVIVTMKLSTGEKNSQEPIAQEKKAFFPNEEGFTLCE